MVKIHRMWNKLAETKVGNDFSGATISALLKQMEDGYRVAFPIFMDQGQVIHCVALLALANDPRLRAIRQLEVAVDATHVFVFLAFPSEKEWLKQAIQIAKLFPEQPGKPELIIATK